MKQIELPAREYKIVEHLQKCQSHYCEADWIARCFEAWEKRKKGSMHLAVKLAARRLESKGIIHIGAPVSEHHSYTYYLQDEFYNPVRCK